MADLSRMPLLRALMDAAEGRFSFHMPGNRQGKSFPCWLRDKLWSLDNTELDVTGDINNPEGAVKEAMDLAARFFAAGETRFVTTGTTTSLLTAIATACPRGTRLIMPRRAHQTIMHAVALLELEPIWAAPEKDETIEQALLREISLNPGAQAIFVTSPDYEGNVVPLGEIVKKAREENIITIVDEAHGSHFAAAPKLLPPSALAQGADLVAMSAHKTLPALTPGSYIHIGRYALENKIISAEKLGQMLKVFQTSSPSFVIAASLDYSRYWLESQGQKAIENLLEMIADIDRQLPWNLQRIKRSGSDPLRLTYDYSQAKISRAAAAKIFALAKVDPEIIDLARIVLIPALDSQREEIDALIQALKSFAAAKGDDQEIRADISWIADLLDQPTVTGIPVGKAFFAQLEKKNILLAEAENSIAAEAIVPYPPGVPMIWPGEIISARHIEAIRQLIAADISVYGVHNSDSCTVLMIE